MIDSENTQQQTKYKVLLIGDSCIDEYYYGTCDRLNPEAPVPVLKITRWSQSFGMAANVKSNLEAFNCDVDFMTGGKKSIKRRYIDDRSKQHIVRVDEDKLSAPFNPYLRSLAYNQYDAVVISDYNKGFITYDNIQEVRHQFKGPIFIDSKKQDLAKFEGCFVKINETEFKQRISECTDLIVTLGSKGAQYKDNIYPTRTAEVIDVCGAGDTFLAALTFEFLRSKDIEQAIRFANQCASISVEHRGVYSLTSDDIDSIII
jgi:bifunctional ADP-heptose synthase (sugar kinase/adenylyltransferase)